MRSTRAGLAVLCAVVVLGASPASDAAENGSIAFSLGAHEVTCDQCGPDGESETFGGANRIWLVRPDGSGRRRLPCAGERRPCSDLSPAFSHDGRRLAVAGVDRLTVMTARGRMPRVLDGLAGWSVSFAPAGRRLALGSDFDSAVGRGLAVTDLAGHAEVVHEGYPQDVAWSRQGRLAWTVSDLNGQGIWVGDAAGRHKRRIARRGRYVAWAPNGRRLAFLTSGSLNVVDADGDRRRVLTRACGLGDYFEGGVAWSPDGREIACPSRRGSLVALNLATMTVRRIISWRQFGNASVGDIAWQPR